jgi:hypothetical protein
VHQELGPVLLPRSWIQEVDSGAEVVN